METSTAYLRIGNLQANGTELSAHDLARIADGIIAFDPVLIADELLKKLKFTRRDSKGYAYWYPDEDCLWSIRQEGNGLWQFCLCDDYGGGSIPTVYKFDPIMRYWHQFQNLYFFLMGKEFEPQ